MITYVRHNSSRTREYQLLTMVVDGEKGRYVVQRACCPEAVPFLLSLLDKHRQLLEAELPLETAPAEKDGDDVRFPYVEGRPLDSRVGDAVRTGDAEALRRVFQDYRGLLEGIPRSRPDPGADGYERFFGEAAGEWGGDCLQVGCLDLILENIFMVDDRYILLDYEWTFPFPLPAALIALRTIMNTYFKYQPYRINELVPVDRLLEDFGIGKEGLDDLMRMEWRFQQAVNQGSMEPGEFLDRQRGILFHRYRPYSSIRELEAELHDTRYRLERAAMELGTARKVLRDREDEIESMRASRFWRAGELYHRLTGMLSRKRR